MDIVVTIREAEASPIAVARRANKGPFVSLNDDGRDISGIINATKPAPKKAPVVLMRR